MGVSSAVDFNTAVRAAKAVSSQGGAFITSAEMQEVLSAATADRVTLSEVDTLLNLAELGTFFSDQAAIENPSTQDVMLTLESSAKLRAFLDSLDVRTPRTWTDAELKGWIGEHRADQRPSSKPTLSPETRDLVLRERFDPFTMDFRGEYAFIDHGKVYLCSVVDGEFTGGRIESWSYVGELPRY
jgi:hypothetical protein